jgi:hypothetical protein
MKIYKIRGFVNRHITRGRNAGTIEQVYFKEEIIIDNLETARQRFEFMKGQVNCYGYYADHSGKAELFEPHIFEDGTLAYWPDKENYIEQFEV